MTEVSGQRHEQASPDCCVVFVVQAGELELKGVLLAASLRRYLRGSYELVAAVPVPGRVWGSISDQTRDLLRDWGVRLAQIENPFGLEYPIANKIAALGVATRARATLYLDTDILCLRTLDLQAVFRGAFCAKPADLATYSTEESSWRRIYEVAGVAFPAQQVRTTHSGESMPPYFNAGVVYAVDGPQFARDWMTACEAIDACATISDKRPWLDQLGLPVTAMRAGGQQTWLDESLNFPAHLKPLDEDSVPVLCHYHWPEILAREASLVRELAVTLAEAPQVEQLLAGQAEWDAVRRVLGRPVPARRGSSGRDFVISGLPRSGTSLLCRLLHEQDDCVVINEPEWATEPYSEVHELWRIPCQYADLRRDIVIGRPIVNKLDNGELVDDTLLCDERALYRPETRGWDFLLGTKNTLSYLPRIRHLVDLVPDLPIIACVRHPVDTIASWVTSFAHLRDARVEQFPVGHPGDPLLSDAQRAELAAIAALTDTAERRARLWCLWAGELLDLADRCHIVRYEALVENPRATLAGIMRAISPGQAATVGPVAALTLSSKRDRLSARERDTIERICGPLAARFGYPGDGGTDAEQMKPMP